MTNTQKRLSKLLSNVANMDILDLIEQYTEANAGLANCHDDPIAYAIGVRIVAAIAAIADARFPGQWRPKTAAHHIDGNPHNNALENLRLVNIKENRSC